jgi:hypothetical protein
MNFFIPTTILPVHHCLTYPSKPFKAVSEHVKSLKKSKLKDAKMRAAVATNMSKTTLPSQEREHAQ